MKYSGESQGKGIRRPLIAENALKSGSTSLDLEGASTIRTSEEGGKHESRTKWCKVFYVALVATLVLLPCMMVIPLLAPSTPSAMTFFNQHQDGWEWDWLRSTGATFGRSSPYPAMTMTLGQDFIYVYQSEHNTCTIAHSGSNSLSGGCWVMDDSTDDVPECGLWGVYRCYKQVTFNFLSHPEWPRLHSYLNSEACSGGVRAAGWSLGGAVASVFATCANNAPGNSSMSQIHIDGVPVLLPRVQELVLFAPDKITTKAQPRNGLALDGVFPGQHFWLESQVSSSLNEIEADMCNFMPHPDSGFHPKMSRIRIRQLLPRVLFGKAPFESTIFPASSSEFVPDYKLRGVCMSELHLSYGFYILAATEAKWA